MANIFHTSIPLVLNQKRILVLVLLTQLKWCKKTLREKHLQPMELPLYINNTTMCLGIVNILYSKIQYHQWNTIIKYYTPLISQLSTNLNNFQQYPGLHLQPTSPSTLFLIIPPSTKYDPYPMRNFSLGLSHHYYYHAFTCCD